MLVEWILNWFVLSVSVFVVTRILPSVPLKAVRQRSLLLSYTGF